MAIFITLTYLSMVVTTQALALDSSQTTHKSSNILNATNVEIKSPEHPINSAVPNNTGAGVANHKDKSLSPKRELSAFFKIGIAINIAMILTFAYWFVGQWRQQK